MRVGISEQLLHHYYMYLSIYAFTQSAHSVAAPLFAAHTGRGPVEHKET